MDFGRFPRTLRLLEQGGTAGHHSGAQFFLRLKGEIALDAAWGEAKEGVAMRTDTLMTWLSSSKPIAAIGIGQLLERGWLTLDQRVAEFVPEFAQGGKEAVTIEHLLTHTCGFRSADSMWSRLTPEENIARACAAPLEAGWVPGETAGYQLSASWFLLGAVIARLTGRRFEEWAREEVFTPLGMADSWFALGPDAYRAYSDSDRIGWLHSTSTGRIEPHRFWDSETGYAHCWPGSSGHGPIRELARIYEMFAGSGTREGVTILQPETVALLTRPRRVGKFDLTFQHVVDWGLGIIVNSNRYGAGTVPYGFGPHSSDAAFGHSGAQTSCGFCDPGHGLVAAWIVNGMAGEAVHRRRARAINAAIYEDLGLAPEGGGAGTESY